MLREWPVSKLEALMAAWSRRKEADRLEARRNAIISGLYANPNLDPAKEGEQGQRLKAVQDIDEAFDEALRRVLFAEEVEKEEREAEEEVKSNPFYRSVRTLMLRLPAAEVKRMMQSMDQVA